MRQVIARWESKRGKDWVEVYEQTSSFDVPGYGYDCCQYDKIEALSDALSEIGLYVEDCTGYYSAVCELTPLPKEVKA